MTLEAAVKHLFSSDSFKEQAKTKSNLRVFKMRYEKGEKIEKDTIIDILQSFNYKVGIDVKPPKK